MVDGTLGEKQNTESKEAPDVPHEATLPPSHHPPALSMIKCESEKSVDPTQERKI